MKKIIIVCCVFLLLVTSGCTQNKDNTISPKNTGALHVAEGNLVDSKGNQVQLKGVSTHGIARVERLINNDLFAEMRNDWGVNIVRLAMYTESQDGYNKSAYFRDKNMSLIEKGIDLATENDMYVIVDWHILQDNNPLRYKEEAKDFFDQVSRKYADHNNVFYEICNEPNNCSWEDVKTYANEVIPVIRANAPEAVIIVGTPDWSQGIDQALASPLDFDNIMYTLHFYAASHKDELRNRLVACREKRLPVFVTEYGITANTGGFPRDIESSNQWMEVLDAYSVSSCIWSLSKVAEACSLISSNTLEVSGFKEEDFTETGKWFIEMMSQYKNR